MPSDFSEEDELRCRRLLAVLHDTPEEQPAANSAAHEALHFAIYAAAGSNWLLRLIRPVWESSERYYLVLPLRRQPAHRPR